MKKMNFLFVNKTASSITNNTDHLTHSLGAQRSAIQRHVQNGRPRPRRPRRPKSRSTAELLLLDDRSLYNPTLRNIACKLDAFNTASVDLDVTVQFLLHYYIFYYQWTISKTDNCNTPELRCKLTTWTFFACSDECAVAASPAASSI